MAAKKSTVTVKSKVKQMVSGQKPTKVTYDGNRLVIVFGDPDNIYIETDDVLIQCDLEEIGVLPTKEDFEEALEEIVHG